MMGYARRYYGLPVIGMATEELNSDYIRKDAAATEGEAFHWRFRHVSVASSMVAEWSPRTA